MESKKLEKPRENGTFSTVQGVMKPDEEERGVFPTKKSLKRSAKVPDIREEIETISGRRGRLKRRQKINTFES